MKYTNIVLFLVIGCLSVSLEQEYELELPAGLLQHILANQDEEVFWHPSLNLLLKQHKQQQRHLLKERLLNRLSFL